MPSFKDIFKIIFISVLFKKERLIKENNIVCVHKIFRVKTRDFQNKNYKINSLQLFALLILLACSVISRLCA